VSASRRFALLPYVWKVATAIVAAVALLGTVAAAGAATVMHQATTDVTRISTETTEALVPGIVRSVLEEQAPALVRAEIQPLHEEMLVGFANIQVAIAEARLEDGQRYATKDEERLARSQLRSEVERLREQVRELTSATMNAGAVLVPVVGDVWAESLDAGAP